MECSKQYLKMISEFRLNVTDVVRRLGESDVVWSSSESSLYDAYCKAEDGVRERLSDNIDTRGALDQIRELITHSNKYMQNSKKVNSQLLYKICNYIDYMFNVFGVPSDKSSVDSTANDGKLSLAEVVAELREEDRSLAKDKELDATGFRQKLLTRSDKLRDEILPRLGVRLEDRDQGAPTIKLVDPEQLLKELADKKAQEAAKKAEKEKKKAEAAAKKQEAMKTLVEPSSLFKTKEYSAWDSAGIPTHDAEGKEITKSQLKKLNKNMEAHKKKYEKMMQSA